MLVRLAEPISERSLTAYLFYQLQWFDKSLDASSIAKQAGHLTAAFAASQCVTSMWWGRAADSPVLGRKGVLVIGLLGSAVSALGMGFSTTYRSAMLFRMLSGALNGNVAVLRTMVSEVVVDNRYRSRAFLLLPMCFNVGNIVGPLMSGVLANPIDSLPSLFGPGSFFGGHDGVQWMSRFPYALPNVVCALLLITSAFGVIFALGETHPLLRHDKPGQRRRLGEGLLGGILKRRNAKPSYQSIAPDDDPEQIREATDERLLDAVATFPSSSSRRDFQLGLDCSSANS
ncbi:MFS domain-containing protein [Fusarium falciforme]|uniref:MFS domain-containing protein n=1 Tax=Fusarium falciforme TaxID=195108 RepID=UPI002300165A|nr:MFS domain-containing protein [Fusarium falciforme]WAO91231.1 MFS domain-containing protein [Fusarium falciforme]